MGESSADTPVTPTSEVLKRLATQARDGEISVQDIADNAGPRVHAAVLAIVALPEALPLPVVGMSAILSIPLIIVSGHMAIFGAGAGLPDGLRKRRLPSSLVRLLAERAAAFLGQVERISKPRLTAVADRSRLMAVMCLILALVVALPIPFGNLPPALCVLLMAIGMTQNDGLLAAAGFGGGLAILIAGVFAADFLVRIFQG